MSNQTIWSGKINSNWSDPGNWSQGAPTTGVHAYIPSMDSISNLPIISKNMKVNYTLKNDGLIHLEAELLIQNNGILQNYGTLKNTSVGSLVNEGNVMNFGEWINEGTFDNKRLFTNKHRLFNEGVIDNENTFVNLGTMVNTGTIDNHKMMNNNGSLENFNTINHHGNAELLNNGFFPEDFIQTSEEIIFEEDSIHLDKVIS